MISPLPKIPAPAPALTVPGTPSAKLAGPSFASLMQTSGFEQHEPIAPQAPASSKLPSTTRTPLQENPASAAQMPDVQIAKPQAAPLTTPAQTTAPRPQITQQIAQRQIPQQEPVPQAPATPQPPAASAKPVHATESQPASEPAGSSESVFRVKPEKKDPKSKDLRKPAVSDTAPTPASPPASPTITDVRPLTLSLPKDQAPVNGQAATQSAPPKTTGANENSSSNPVAPFASDPAATGVSERSDIRPARKAPVAFSVNLPKAQPASLPVVPRTPAVNPAAPSAKNSTNTLKPTQPTAARTSASASDSEQPAAPPHKSAPELILKSQPATVLTNVIPANSAVGVVPGAPHVPAAYSNQLTVKAQDTLPAAHVQQASEAAPLNAAQRPQTIDLKIAGDQNGDVAVRISQRAGDVQVTVRTADGDLAQSLKQHLPELSDRLVQTGVHGDIWQPSAAQSSLSESNGNGNADSWKGHDAQSQQQGRNPGNAPDPNDEESSGRSSSAWIDELMNAKKEN